jgi:hypothetical protein
MATTPENSAETPADSEKQKQESAKRLRALLDGVDLAPEQTSDDIAPKTSRDRELLEDVPPHHGT